MAISEPGLVTQFVQNLGFEVIDDKGTTVKSAFTRTLPTDDDTYNRLGQITQWITSDQARYTGLSSVIGMIATAAIPVVSKNKYTFGLGGLGGAIAGYLLFDSISSVVESVENFNPIEYVLSIPGRIANWFVDSLSSVMKRIFSFLPGV